ncbi:MAG: GGDEF domain-containing protein [bacterium]
MYSREYLSSFSFFRTLLENDGLASIHDSLTEVISRGFILQFVRELIQSGTPFTLAMVDLDNFKDINDTYGHRMGDKVLQLVAGKLQDYIGEKGLVGRFGGDEFLMLSFTCLTYDDVHTLYDGLQDGTILFRKTHQVGGREFFLTGTVGSATFPKDADTYESLFHLVDKCLYRGKSKGRNCHIIYVEAKHKKLEITTMARHSLYLTFSEVVAAFDRGGRFLERLRAAFRPMQEHLRLYELYYVSRCGALLSVRDGTTMETDCQIDAARAQALYTPRYMEDLAEVSPVLYRALDGMSYQAALLMRVRIREESWGYLVLCPEPATMRIWQDDEFAAALFLARLAGEYLAEKKK